MSSSHSATDATIDSHNMDPMRVLHLAASMRAVRELPEDTVEQIQNKQQRYQSVHGDPHLTN